MGQIVSNLFVQDINLNILNFAYWYINFFAIFKGYYLKRWVFLLSFIKTTTGPGQVVFMVGWSYYRGEI
jgi:hypothetical protein